MKNFQTCLFIILIILGCKHEDSNLPKRSIIIVDSVSNYYYGLDLYYRLKLDGGNPPYSVVWTNPKDNIGNGPFHLILKDNIIISYIFLDKTNGHNLTEDTIETFTKIDLADLINNKNLCKYDYRDKITGKYLCKIRDVNWCIDTTIFDKNYFDTISVNNSIKQNEVEFLTYNFDIDSIYRGDCMVIQCPDVVFIQI